jgi:hypothetical protein
MIVKSEYPSKNNNQTITLLLLSNVVHAIDTLGEFETKEEREFENAENDTEEALANAGEELEDAGDKVKAGAKAVANKITDPDKDLDNEYQKEKMEERMD